MNARDFVVVGFCFLVLFVQQEVLASDDEYLMTLRDDQQDMLLS